MQHIDLIDLAAALGDEAQAIAIDLHRHGVAGITDHQHTTVVGRGGDDLPDEAIGIEHRQADAHAILLAAVHHHAVGERVSIEGQQLGGDIGDVATLPGIEQFAQARILGGQARHALHTAGQIEQLFAQRAILVGKLLLVGKHQRAPADAFRRQADDPLHGRYQRRHAGAHIDHPAEAIFGKHQRE